MSTQIISNTYKRIWYKVFKIWISTFAQTDTKFLFLLGRIICSRLLNNKLWNTHFKNFMMSPQYCFASLMSTFPFFAVRNMSNNCNVGIMELPTRFCVVCNFTSLACAFVGIVSQISLLTLGADRHVTFFGLSYLAESSFTFFGLFFPLNNFSIIFRLPCILVLDLERKEK